MRDLDKIKLGPSLEIGDNAELGEQRCRRDQRTAPTAMSHTSPPNYSSFLGSINPKQNCLPIVFITVSCETLFHLLYTKNTKSTMKPQILSNQRKRFSLRFFDDDES